MKLYFKVKMTQIHTIKCIIYSEEINSYIPIFMCNSQHRINKDTYVYKYTLFIHTYIH